MRVITVQCPACGGIVAGNVLERYGRVECPGLDCHHVHEFDYLDEEDRRTLRDRADQ